MKIKSIRQILILVLIWTSLIFILPWEGTTTVPGAYEPNLRPSNTLDAESHRSLKKAAACALPQQYVAHEPIAIKTNAGFAALDFPGEGSPSNPYVIEGLNITSACQTLIYIEDTTAHFSIRNNLLNSLTGEHDGIYLIYVANGTIDSNIISNCENGMYLNTWGSTIVHNTISNCGEDGIYLKYSEGSTIDYNTISNCSEDGIELEDCTSGNSIAHNTISNCGEDGIYLKYSEGNTIDYNTISNCSKDGIELEDCTSENSIAYNTISNCGENGIYLDDYTSGTTITHNTISNCGGAGIFLCNVQGISRKGINTLVGNRLVNNGLVVSIGVGAALLVEPYFFLGTVADNMVNDRPLVYWENVRGGTVPPGAGQVILINTTGVEVTGQNLSRASIGLFAALSSNLNIHHNTLSGIHLSWSENNTVAHNTVSQNTRGGGMGIYLGKSKGDIVSNNTISQNSNGIVLEGRGQNTLAHNIVSQNSNGIILTDAWQNTVAHNTVSYNRGYGIKFIGPSEYPSTDNTVTENDFLGNRPGGGSQAYDNGNGNVFARNYWADHDNTDRNGDGIADAPYPIEGDASNQDSAPLAFPANLNRHLLLIPIIQYPKGGETLQGMEMIEWAGTLDSLGHPVTYTVAYSPDNGSTWIPLASGLSTTSYEWNTTTVAEGSAYRIQVVATCADGLSTEDCLDAPFTIRTIAHSLPSPTITYPNSGETLQGTVTLHWTPTNDTWKHSVTYTVSYSANDGQTWILLASGLTRPSYEWDTTTVADGSAYRVQIVATCSEGFTVADVSDALFSIQNPEPTTTSLLPVRAFPTLGGPVGMLLVILLLATILVRRVKRKSR